jgi:hypothetical protein
MRISWWNFIFAFFLLTPGLVSSQNPKKGKEKSEEREKDDPAAVVPQLLRGPYLQQVSPHSIMIRWRTDALSRSRVTLGSAPGSLDLTTDDSALVTEHKVIIRSLHPETRYFYSIGDIRNPLQGDSNNYFFTLPESGKEGVYRIGVFGDCGNNSVNQRNVRDQFLQYLGNNYLNAWILLGDNTYPDGTDAEFQMNFFNIYKDNLLKKYPLFPSPGNHDYHDKEFSAAVAQETHDIAYYQNFSMPTAGESGGLASHTAAFYSFDIGNVHFLSLDSYGKEENTRLYDTLGPQVAWIKKDLAQTKSKWIVAYFHHPPFTMGSHSSDKEQELVKIREQFIPVLERLGVDLVLCGHSHDYERSRLMTGYYGMEDNFDSARYTLSGSSGRNDGTNNSQPYMKHGLRERGTVYVVTGSAGKLGGQQPSFPHNAMFYANATDGGSSLLEVTGDRLDFKWICADGVIRDRFTITKDAIH